MEMPLTAVQPTAKARLNVWPTVLVFLIAVLVRLGAGATLPMFQDEPWQLLAGQSWIHEGTLRVDQGVYARAAFHTMLVAWFMEAFGETLAVARLPGSIAGAALVAAVFGWLRQKSGMVAGWTGATLLCFHDLSIVLSAEVRFYSLQALCLWLAAAIVYQVTAGEREHRQPVWMLAIAAALSALALHLQVTTGVALVALLSWAACDLAYRFRTRLWRLLRGHWLLAAAAGAIVLIGAAVIVLDPPAALARQYATFRYTAHWAERGQDWVFFYQRFYSTSITLIWGLFPLAFLAALIHRPRAAIFCASLFVVPTIIMSFGGMKSGRYIFFTIPYLFAIWGLAAEAVFPRAVQIGYKAWERAWNLIMGSPSGSMAASQQRLRRYSFVTAAILALAFAVISQPSYRESTKIVFKSALTALSRPGKLLVGPDLGPLESHRSELTATIERASVFIAAMPSTMLYVLGPHDVILSANATVETPEGGEFAIDRRVGRPAIASVESLQAIMRCYQTGIVIVMGVQWRHRAGVTEDVANLLMARARLTRFKGAAPKGEEDVLVFEWQGRPDEASPQCDEVRSKVARTS
jgi:4-amino-4-deoxy-L-arabinose transferase-like glycosyltransferase